MKRHTLQGKYFSLKYQKHLQKLSFEWKNDCESEEFEEEFAYSNPIAYEYLQVRETDLKAKKLLKSYI